MNTKITDTERKELDTLLIQRADIEQKIAAITDKHPYCFECGAFEGELHELGCDNERCPYCGGQLVACLCQRWDEEKNTLIRWDRYPRTDEARAEFESLRLPFVGDGRQLPKGYIPLNWQGEFDPMTGYGDKVSEWHKSGAKFLADRLNIPTIYAEG